jgi:hypothetical protein
VLLAVLVAPLLAQQLQAATRQLAEQAQTHSGPHASQSLSPLGRPGQRHDLAAAVAAGHPLQGLLMELALTCIEQVRVCYWHTRCASCRCDLRTVASRSLSGTLLALALDMGLDRTVIQSPGHLHTLPHKHAASCWYVLDHHTLAAAAATGGNHCAVHCRRHPPPRPQPPGCSTPGAGSWAAAGGLAPPEPCQAAPASITEQATARQG